MGALRELLTRVVSGAAGSTAPPTEAETVAKWQDELRQAKKFFEPFHKQAQKAVDRYLDNKSKGQGEAVGTAPLYRLNLFHSNIVTLESMLYAKIPKAEADRRFFDPADDVARVAAEMVTRIIQNDMNDPDDKLNDVLKSCLQDRLVSGLGTARVKYYMDETPVVDYTTGQQAIDPATGQPLTQKSDEWCDTIYVHWRDILWSPSRVASELRWKAFRSYMTKDEVEKRWGVETAEAIPYTRSAPRLQADKANDIEQVKAEAEIWEVWDGEGKQTCWLVEGYSKFLEVQPDPMELGGFYPDAKPMLANTSTSKYLPKPDYFFAQDLYSEIDELETRIALLTQAAKCVGVYDRGSKDIGRMLKEGVENEMIPVDNWAMFAEKGGIKGMTDWLPLDSVVNAISVLSAQQASRINQLYQVTGLSDIMRGQATQNNVTATEQRIKAQFGSGRIQAIQEEFASFTSDLLNKKVQLIQRFYDPERIKQLSNILNTPDAQLADQAVALIKNSDQFNIRVAVRSESMAQENLDAVKEQRAALIQGVAQFLGMATPMIEKQPESAPFLLELLQFSVAGFNGAAEMEGVIDQFAAQVKQKLAQPPPPPPPDPAMIKAQADAQAKQQDAQLAQQQFQQESALRQQEMQQAQQEGNIRLMEMQQQMQLDRKEHALRMAEIAAQLNAIVITSQAKVDAAKATAEAKVENASAVSV
jgi:hypothetical protein